MTPPAPKLPFLEELRARARRHGHTGDVRDFVYDLYAEAGLALPDMRPTGADTSTWSDDQPCIACPLMWRDLFAAAQLLLAYNTRAVPAGAGYERAVTATAAALQVVAPFVDAHNENQAHAFSQVLETARAATSLPPTTEATTDVED